MVYIWLVIVIFLSLIELFTINLTTIWFVVSALVALFLSMAIHNFYIEFAVFVVLGIILLITTRPLLLKIFMKRQNERTNIDRIIGMKGIIIKDIPINEIGEVKVDGKIWFAYADSEILASTFVEVLEINGTKLKVKGVE